MNVKPKAINVEDGLRFCEECVSGHMTIKEAARQLGVCLKTLWTFRKEHGYLQKDREFKRAPFTQRRTNCGRKLTTPTERDFKAIREYQEHKCTLRDVCEYCGVSYSVAKRWVTNY